MKIQLLAYQVFSPTALPKSIGQDRVQWWRQSSKIEMAVAQIKEALSHGLPRLRRIQRNNIRVLRERPWQEIGGALGDLGTLFPIFVALAGTGSMSVSSTLVFSGLANILTGIFFGIPLPCSAYDGHRCGCHRREIFGVSASIGRSLRCSCY